LIPGHSYLCGLWMNELGNKISCPTCVLNKRGEQNVMEELSATLIYWYMSCGSIAGLVVGSIIGKEGVSFGANLVWGICGGVIMGVIGLYMGLQDGIWFSFLAVWPFLFIVNVFHYHHVEDVMEEMEHPAKIIPKK